MERTDDTLHAVLRDILCLLHPFMPFITVELLQTTETVFFPKIDEAFLNHPENIAMARSVDQMIIETVTKIRNVRGEMNIPLSEEMSLFMDVQDKNLSPFLPYIKRLARIRDITIMTDPSAPKRSAVISTTYGVIYLLLENPHIQKEIDRLFRVAQKLSKEMAGVANRLNNKDFINAPDEVQTKTQNAYNELKQKKQNGVEQISRMQELLGQ